ncbi:stAR-related lipid transfer protein 9 [Pyxicephalus adspersus]|uniref:stAR-related lipid transfer protein 9 n=1 Tax=Pyxicephalus adspersus TaxID=30357 RepID=UPI003B5A9CF7
MANVKVALRVRPLSKREIAEGAKIILKVDNKIARIRNTKLDYRADGCGDTRERFMEFGFDYCYCSVDPDDTKYASQEVVFQDLGTTVLSEAIKGYNVCLFAYGQTGSGKTYTMMGTPTSIGLTPRICEGLFCYDGDSLGTPPSCRIEVSFLEIYNERVRDLLHQADQKKPYTLRVREHPEKGPYVQGLSQHIVTSYEQVVALLEKGMESRITAATHIHDASSRSHAIFTIQYTQAILEDNLPSEITSKVNLVDLAGSERASPNYCKDRLTEGSNINRSLVTLGIVISALAQNSQMSSSCQSINSIISDVDSGIQGSSPSRSSINGSKRQPFVPYRDSILTWLLKDSLGGNSKTIMIATVSPASISYNETMSTLRYASNAKNIINKPRVNEDTNVKLIRELREEINRLKSMLRNFEMRTISPAFSEERDGNLTELVRQNELKIEQLTKDWTDKWTDKAALMEQYNMDINHGKARVSIDSGLPHLIAVDDDILSTGVVIYHLKEGTTIIGKGDHDIVLQSESIERDHCVIENNFGVVELRPVPGAQCTVNGQEVTDVCRLSQGAVIVLGKSHRFRFNHPAEAAVLRQMRSESQASFVSDCSLDWLDLSGDLSSSKENSLILNTSASTETLSEKYQQQIKDLESSYQQQVEEQQKYVKDLKRQIRVAQVKGEKELEQEQILLNQQIQENQQWLVKENQRLTAVCQQRKESAAQTEAKTYAEVEIQNCVQTEIQPSPEELDRKQLLQLELLRKCSFRRAERNIRRKRVKLQLERIVKKQKLLEAKKTLQQLEAACWINDNALKPTYLHVPKLQDPAVHSTSPERTRSSPSIISYYRRRSLSWTLQTLPTYSSLLKRKCKSELVQKSFPCESKKPLRAVSIDCLPKTSSTCSNCDEVDSEVSIVESSTSQAEKAKKIINLLISQRNSLFPSDSQMSKKRQKMDKAGGKSKGLSSCPTQPPKKRNVRVPLNTGTKDTKLKAAKSHPQPSVGITRKNTVLEKSNLTARSDSIKPPAEKYVKNTQRPPGQGKIPPKEAVTVKAVRKNTTISTSNTKTKPVHGTNKISSSVDNISKLNNHCEDHNATDKSWMSTERLNRGLLRSNKPRIEHWKEDDNNDSSDSESFYSVDSLSSAYASALNEQLKQEEEKKKNSRRDSDSEDSQISQDSLVERENKKDRHNKRRYNRYKTIGTNSSTSKSLTDDHNSFPLVTTGSVTTGFSKSFSLDSLADADEVPDADSSEELPAEIFWKLQSPRSLNMNDDDHPNVDISRTGENTAIERSASFYLRINEDASMRNRDTSTKPLNVPNVKSYQIYHSPPVLNSEYTFPEIIPSEKGVVEPTLNALDQDISCFENGVAKTDSDFTQDEGKKESIKNDVIYSNSMASPDIQEELNAQYCQGPEPLCNNLNICNVEENLPYNSPMKVKCFENQRPDDEFIKINSDYSDTLLDEFSTSKDHSDLLNDITEGENDTQKCFLDIEKKNVDLEASGFVKDGANKIPQPLMEPSTDEVSNKDTMKNVYRDFRISVETCSQYLKDNHKESEEPKKVKIKASHKQENNEEREQAECDENLSTSLNISKSASTGLLNNSNQDMRQNTQSQLISNETLSDSFDSDEICRCRDMFVFHSAQKDGEMDDHTNATTCVQTDYLNNQPQNLSEICSEHNRFKSKNLESGKKQKPVTGITNVLQAEGEQNNNDFSTTNLVSQMTSYNSTLDLNGNKDYNLEKQHLVDKYNVYTNKAADPLQRLNIDRLGQTVVADNADITTSEKEKDINEIQLLTYENQHQHNKSLGKDASSTRNENESAYKYRTLSCSSTETDMEVTSSSSVTNLAGLSSIEHLLQKSSTSPIGNISEYNSPTQKNRENGCNSNQKVHILSYCSETFQLTALSDNICHIYHPALDINSNKQGDLSSMCEDNAGPQSVLINEQCVKTCSLSTESLIQTQPWKEKGIGEGRIQDSLFLSADSQKVHGLESKPLNTHNISELLNCKIDTQSEQSDKISLSAQPVHKEAQTSQLFNSSNNDKQKISGFKSPDAYPLFCNKSNGEDAEISWNDIAGQNLQSLKEITKETLTSETEGLFAHSKQEKEDHEHIKKINDNKNNGKECASRGKPEDLSPSNEQVIIKHDMSEKCNSSTHYDKGASKDKHDNHVTTTQDSTTSGRCFQTQMVDTVTDDNKDFNSADTSCWNTKNLQEHRYCVDQFSTQDTGIAYPRLPYYEAIMQGKHVSEPKSIKTKPVNTAYESAQSLHNNSKSIQPHFGLKCLPGLKNMVDVSGENNTSKTSRILKPKEGKMSFKPKNGKLECNNPHGTGTCVGVNEDIQEDSAVNKKDKLPHFSRSVVHSFAEVHDNNSSFRDTNIQGSPQENGGKSEQIFHELGREIYQTKEQNFSVHAQKVNLVMQQTFPSKCKIIQESEIPLAKDEFEDKTGAIFPQNPTYQSESFYPCVTYSSNACTLPAAVSSSNPYEASQEPNEVLFGIQNDTFKCQYRCNQEPNEMQKDRQNDTKKCQYELAQSPGLNKQTEIFLSCQPSSFRPCKETEAMEKTNVDYGFDDKCVTFISTTNKWEHNPNYKLSSLMNKSTSQATEFIDSCGVSVISGHAIEKTDPSLQMNYITKKNEEAENNISVTSADCGECHPDRFPEISPEEHSTKTSSSLVSSGLTNLKMGSLDSLPVLNEGISEMCGGNNTDVLGDFSHNAFHKTDPSHCTMSNKAHCSTHTLRECVPTSMSHAESQLPESLEVPPDGSTSSLRSESSSQSLDSSTKTTVDRQDHRNINSMDLLQHSAAECKINICLSDHYQPSNCSANAQECAVGHTHFKDEITDKSYVSMKVPRTLHSNLFHDSSQQTQTSIEELVENAEGLHFSSSDINPFVHSWQQEVSPRAGWRNSFNSASDVSCSKLQATADKLLRCSSVDEGLNFHSSPFNSHLSSYANAKPASSTISSFEGNDSRPDLNSLDGFQDQLLDDAVTMRMENDMEFVETSESQVRFEDCSQLDEIMILYTSESETCNENDQRLSYEHRIRTKPRYRRSTKHQRSNTDVSSSRQMRYQKPVTWSNVQSMSLHLSQLLQETSELLGNLSQHRPENVPLDVIGLPKDAAESVLKKSVRDSYTQTYEDKCVQTDKSKINSVQNYGTESNSFLNPSEINVIVKVVGGDTAHIPHNVDLTGEQSSVQTPKVRTQSLPNLHADVPSKPAEHKMSESPHVRASVPFLNSLKDVCVRSFPFSSTRSSPVSVTSNKDVEDISPAVVNCPLSGVGETLRCHTVSQENTMMVDRASSPILTLKASKKLFNNFELENYSTAHNFEKVSRHRKRREREHYDQLVTSSQTETDSESICSFGQGNEYEVMHCSSLRESPKRRIATHKPQRYKSEGCILQNKSSQFTNQFSSNSEISGYGDREGRKGNFRSIQPKKVPLTAFAALPQWQHPQSLENLSQMAQPVLDRQKEFLTITARKEYVAENDFASSTVTSRNSYTKNKNYPQSPSQVSGYDFQLQEDGLSVVESECNTDILLGQEPSSANSHKSYNYSLQDLPLHNKFSNWSGVQGSSKNAQMLMSYPSLSVKQSPTYKSQEEMESRCREIERLQRERAEVMSAVHLELNPQPLTVQLAEAKLSYGIGETDALLRVIQTGKMDSHDQVSIKKQLYERHMKVIENLRKEREEKLQCFRRSRSLSPQKHLSASQTSLSSLRDSDLPSRRREYLQQLRKDVVDSTRIQEPKKSTAQCPSEIEAMLKDYQKAREEARTEIARARDKLRERAEQEKRRLLQSTLQKEDTKMKTLVSTSTLFTNSSLSLSSGPTSGYNSGMTTTPAKGNKSTLQVSKTLPTGLDFELGSGRGRSAVRNSYLLLPTQKTLFSEPNTNQPPPDKTPATEALPTFCARLQSTPVLYQDLATQVQVSAMAEVMAACSYDVKNLFNGKAAAGWIYRTTEKDVLVYYKAFSSPTKHGFIGAGVIRRPLHNVWDMVKDIHARRLYDQSILSACVHQRVSSTVQLVHVMMDMSLCYLKQPRDFCCITVESKEEKCFSLCFQSVHNESMPRPNKDVVRGEILPSAWILQPDSTHGETITRVIYMVQADLGAPAIPSRLLSVVSKRQPLVISNLANFFSR